MLAFSSPLALDQFPPDLIQAVVQKAASDAGRVVKFLDALNLRPTGKGGTRTPISLPAFFLVGLGAALRLLAWEYGGLNTHRDAGLPSADEALRQVFQSVASPEPVEAKVRAADQLAARVFTVFVERLAWNGRAYLDADLELGGVDEDALVEAVASFLWAHRHTGDDRALSEGGAS
jgi:hypothetical protein